MSSLPPPPPSPASTPADSVGPVDADPRRWGLGDMWLGLVIANVAVVIVLSVVLVAGDYDDTDSLPMWLFSAVNAPLHIGLLTVAVWAVTTKGRGVIADLRFTAKAGDAGKGILAGILAQLILVPAVTFPIIWLTDTDTDEVSRTARDLADRANTAPGVVSLVLTTVVLAPIVEELFFRGLTFEALKKRRNLAWLERAPRRLRPDTLSRRWNLGVAMVLSSVVFSVVHFNALLFPALFAVGMVFAWLAQRYGRLGPALWAHAAFNGTTVLSLLVIEGDDDAVSTMVGLLCL